MSIKIATPIFVVKYFYFENINFVIVFLVRSRLFMIFSRVVAVEGGCIVSK